MKLPEQRNIFQIPQAEKMLSALLPRLAEKRTQSFTSIVLALITLSFLGVFAIGPTLSTIADLQKQISDDQQVTQDLKQKITNLSLLQNSYRSIQNDLPILYTAIPTTPQTTTLIGQIQAIAQNANVTLFNIQTLSVNIITLPTAQYNSYVFSLDVSGSYDNLALFLENVSSFNRLITLDALSLIKPSGQNSAYSLSIRGKAYFKSS